MAERLVICARLGNVAMTVTGKGGMRGIGLLAAIALFSAGTALAAIALFSAGTALAAAPQSATPQSATPLENPANWIVTTDYPGEALLSRAEGEVGFVLTLDPGGRVSGCRISQSSGSDVLDRTTCSLLTERARFSPARDANGDPVPGSYSSRVYWLAPFQP